VENGGEPSGGEILLEDDGESHTIQVRLGRRASPLPEPALTTPEFVAEPRA
jgi:hypothetical protein